MSLFEAVEGHLTDGGLTDGYQVLWHRWRDEHVEAKAPPFICLRRDGGGVSDELGQAPIMAIRVCGRPNAVSVTEERIRAIKSYLIEHFTHGDVIAYQILADYIGPFMLENDRPIFELNVRVMAEIGL